MTDQERSGVNREIKDRLKECRSLDKQYKQCAEDLRFASGDQWHASDLANREDLPCLTVNVTRGYINRICNPVKKNPYGAHCTHKDPAKSLLFQGLIHEIEYQSNAESVYGTAFENMVTTGLGYWTIDTEYVDGSETEQVPRLKRCDDITSIYKDPWAKELDGSDIEYGFKVGYLPKDIAEKKYKLSETEEHNLYAQDMYSDWEVPEDSVAEVVYYSKVYEKATKYWKQDGSSSTVEPEMYIKKRPTTETKVRCIKFVGGKKIYDQVWPVKHIPIIQVSGDRKFDGSWKGFSGVVELLRESQRGLNLASSAERQIQESAPVSPWVIAEGQTEGHEELWETANTKAWSSLVYTPKTYAGQLLPPPARVDNRAQTEHLMASKNMHIQDMGRQVGIFDNQLGQTEIAGESGRAVFLKREAGEVAHVHYTSNFEKSVAYGGRVLMDFILATMDTDRELTIRNKGQSQQLQGNLADEGVTTDDFDYEITSGPLQQAEKQEIVQMAMELAPMIGADKMSNLADVMVENSGLAGSEKLVERLRKMLPPELQPEDPNADAVDPETQQVIEQLQGSIQQLQGHLDSAEGIITNLAQQLLNDEAERNTKVQIQEMKNTADLAIAQLNAQTKLTTTEATLDSKIIADAQSRTEELGTPTQNSEDLEQMVQEPDMDDAMLQTEKVGGEIDGQFQDLEEVEDIAGLMETTDNLDTEGVE